MTSTSVRVAMATLVLGAFMASGCARSSPKAPPGTFASCVAPHARVAAPATSLPAAAPRSGSRLTNLTCPVVVGAAVDPNVTTLWQGRVVAFSDAFARTRWEQDPSRYSHNLAGFASGTSSDRFAPSSARIVAPAACSAPAPARAVTSIAPLPVASAPRRGAAGPIGPAPKFVGSPDGDEEEAPACADDEECCPGGNCRLPGR